jgi:hypothetical protein
MRALNAASSLNPLKSGTGSQTAAGPRQGEPTRRQAARPRRVSKIPAQIRHDLQAISRKHRELCAGDRDLAYRAARFYRSQVLPPRKRGAKPKPHVLKAVSMLKALGRKPNTKDWQKIYSACILGFKKLNYAERRHQSDNLRSAAKARLKRKQIRARNRSRN